jgi:hypothetical protein
MVARDAWSLVVGHALLFSGGFCLAAFVLIASC